MYSPRDHPQTHPALPTADHGKIERFHRTLAAKYHRLIVETGKHHNSALCHIATALLTRVVACWRNQTPYELRDTDGRPISTAEARAIIAERYAIPDEIRRARTTTATGRRSKESQSAPSTGPSRSHARPAGAA